MQGVFNPNILIYHPPNSAEGLHFSAFHIYKYQGFYGVNIIMFCIVVALIMRRSKNNIFATQRNIRIWLAELRCRKTMQNESTEVQTLGAIRIELYHQCFEQVWQHNFTSIIGIRRSTQRHRSSKVDTSIVDLRKSTHRSSKVDTSIFED